MEGMISSIKIGAVVCLSSVAASQVRAQTSDAASEMSSPASADQTSGAVGDIVVTAQRREQRLQDVPIAVSALTSDTAASVGVSDTRSIQVLVPSLQFTGATGASTPFIRGFGSANTIAGNESSVATYVDGVYIASLYATSFSLNNIERVEVLKGPQGTLFGRNASAGVINIVTKTPSFTPTADISLGYGNYNTLEGNFYGSTGLTDFAAIDLAAYYRNQDHGFGRNPTTGQEMFRPKEIALRSKLLLNLGSLTTLTLAADYNRITRDVTGLVLYDGSLGVDGVTRQRGFYDPQGNLIEQGTRRQYGFSGKLEHDLGFAQLVSISAYRNSKQYNPLDQDATPARVVDVDINVKDTTFSQELQLLSPKGASLDWILGLFYFHENAAYTPTRLSGAATAPLPYIDLYGRLRTNSYAAYAQGTKEIFDATKLTLGLRFTRDERRIDGYLGTVIGPLAPGDQKKSFNKLTWRVSLDRRFSDEVLAYASYNRGFKSGVFNPTAVNDPAVEPEVNDSYEIGLKTDLFDRHLRLNGALFQSNISNVQLQRVQGTIAIFNAGKARVRGAELEFDARPIEALSLRGGVTYLDGEYTSFPNAPVYSPIVNAAGVPTGGNVLTTPDGSGAQMVLAPKWTASVGGTYTIDLAAAGRLQLAANYAYTASYPFVPGSARVRQPSTDIVNASLSWTSKNDSFGAKVWVKNALDQKYWFYLGASDTGDYGTPNLPRTYGVSVFAHF